MKFVSCFTGIGGFDEGFEQAGMTCVAQIEIDRWCNTVLEDHWPNIQRFGDIASVKAKKIKEADVYCGGFPCQDVSQAGLRAGLAGERSKLFFELARLIEENKPRWIVIENVPGLLSSNQGRDMGTIIGKMAEFGYGMAWRVLDAKNFGIPQRRRRLFIVGCRGSLQSAAQVLLESESLCGSNPQKPAERQRSNRSGVVDSTYVRSFDNGKRVIILPKVAATLLTHATRNNPDQTWLVLLNRKKLTVDVRRLTPVESERIQGFPDGWTSTLSDGNRIKTLGNAVAVPVSRWIGERILIADLDRKARQSATQ